jgi:hypothetical protein
LDSASAAPAGVVEPPSGAEKGGEGKPDIDELTRRVYLDIKRRLTREWERARGRD